MSLSNKSRSRGVLSNNPSMGVTSERDLIPLRPIFYADYTDRILDAQISEGSATATITASRGASNPATYFDADGVMQVTTTSDTARYTYGIPKSGQAFTIFDGGKPGILLESAKTNYLVHSIFDTDTDVDGFADGWTKFNNFTGSPTFSLVDVSSAFNVGATVQAQRIQYTGVSGDTSKSFTIGSDHTAVGSFAQNDYASFSLWIKGSATGVTVSIRIIARDAAGASLGVAGSPVTITGLSSTEFKFYSVSAQLTDVSTSKIEVQFLSASVDDGDTLDYQIACAQAEKNNFPTSFIPTTTAALTRNGEELKYAVSSNRNVAAETGIFKVAPNWSSTENTINKTISSVDTKGRYIYFDTTPLLNAKPNSTDNGTVNATSNPTFSASDILTIAYSCQHSSPYMKTFVNGSASGEYTAGDWTANAWGTSFYIGCRANGSADEQFNGVFFDVGFFDIVLSSKQQQQAHGSITNVYKGS